ncbi:hypothetical protein MKD50_00190 [Cupriavidus sp. WGtm5]|uniref:hypothetical protein n=1 Tax=Cupriavidus sp. WGtm5 TaxID=2919926 RepID=UPI002091222F|nr:hypothetical protein [Cupriavidus sp. WGtm5]MCO4887777.1 hypothetical protein [Cupriavidus sp. WGtm5]
MTTAGFGPPFALGRGRGSSARVPLTRGIGSGEPANHKVRYHGAVPVCGVLGDTELINYFGAYQTAA